MENTNSFFKLKEVTLDAYNLNTKQPLLQDKKEFTWNDCWMEMFMSIVLLTSCSLWLYSLYFVKYSFNYEWKQIK